MLYLCGFLMFVFVECVFCCVLNVCVCGVCVL